MSAGADGPRTAEDHDLIGLTTDEVIEEQHRLLMQARAERDRYRAALEAIPGALPDLGMRTVRRIVREALEGKK